MAHCCLWSGDCHERGVRNIAPTFYREIDHWNLPIQCPFKSEELKRFACQPSQEGYSLELRTGWLLSLDWGVMTSFDSPTIRNHRLRAKPGDRATVSLAQALAVATNLVARLGLPDNVTWVHLRPRIEKPRMPGCPYYEFTWPEPQEQDLDTVRVDVDCRDRSIVSAHFYCLYKQLVANVPATPRPRRKGNPNCYHQPAAAARHPPTAAPKHGR